MACLLKDASRQVSIYTYRKCADKRLTGWIATTAESGVAELKRFAKGLLEAKEQILNFCQHRIINARIEAFNAIVNRVTHKACGVANLDFFFQVNHDRKTALAPQKALLVQPKAPEPLQPARDGRGGGGE